VVDGEGGVSELNDQVWQKRFQWFALVRMIGVATFLLGIAMAFTDLVRLGGWPVVGGLVAIAGAIDAVFAPRLLKKLWAQQDQQ
jgi:hypothetical protein